MVIASGHAMHLGVETHESCYPLELSLKTLMCFAYYHQCLEEYVVRFDVVNGCDCNIAA